MRWLWQAIRSLERAKCNRVRLTTADPARVAFAMTPATRPKRCELESPQYPELLVPYYAARLLEA
jgi:hypothetical protein